MLRWLFGLPGDVWRFTRVLRKDRPDVAHVNGAFFLAPAIAAKLAGVPLVWHLNDTVIPRRAAPVFGALVRRLADRVVVAAEAVARHYAVTSAPYTVIHAPVAVEEFRIAETGREEGMRRVGLVGNWNPLKGLEYFVRAAVLVRDEVESEVEFVFAGAHLDTHAEYARCIDALIDDLKLRPAVEDLGFVQSIAPVLKSLDVLVLSSNSEASPMVVLEAMASSVPVVATDVGGVREMLLGDPVRPAGTVVPPQDPEAISQAIVRLLKDTGEAARLGANGRQLAEERFSLEICARRHLEVYKSLTKG